MGCDDGDLKTVKRLESKQESPCTPCSSKLTDERKRGQVGTDRCEGITVFSNVAASPLAICQRSTVLTAIIPSLRKIHMTIPKLGLGAQGPKVMKVEPKVCKYGKS